MSGISMRVAFRLLAIGVVVLAPLQTVAAQPVFDGTTGGQVPGSVATETIDVSQGTRAGGNVFHSFSDFSIPAGQTVTFTDNTPTTPVANIINRVTGTDISEIYGTLRSTVDGADFYLINPNGIVIGPGSSIDVPASFHLSTADELRFEGGEVLQANAGSSTFTSAVPKAFGFTDAVVGDITMTGAQIHGQPGSTINLVGGNIRIGEDGFFTRLAAKDGQINIVGISGVGNVPMSPQAADLVAARFGDVSIQGSPIDPSSTTIASSVFVRAEDFSIIDAIILGGNVSIEATENASILGATTVQSGDAWISKSVPDQPGTTIGTIPRGSPLQSRVGDISISGRNILIRRDTPGVLGQNSIRTIAEDGDAEHDIRLTAVENITIRNYGVIQTFSIGGTRTSNIILTAHTVDILADDVPPSGFFFGLGNPNIIAVGAVGGVGDISIHANRFRMQASGMYVTGARGDINIDAVDEISLSQAFIWLNSFVDFVEGCVPSCDLPGGFFGNVSLRSDGAVAMHHTQIRVEGGIFGSAASAAVNLPSDVGGRVAVHGAARVVLTGTNPNLGTAVLSNLTVSDGTAVSGLTNFGAISITSDGRITIDGGSATSSGAPVNFAADQIDLLSGILGSSNQDRPVSVDLTLSANVVRMLGGTISVMSLIDDVGFTRKLSIVAAQLIVSGSNSVITADGLLGGSGGQIAISADTVDILNGGKLSAVSNGTGNAGTITVCCGASFNVSGASSQVIAGTAPGSTGDAGRILISAKDVRLTDGGRMTVASNGSGRGGEILVRAQKLTAEDPNRVSEGRPAAEAAGLATLSSAAGTDSSAAGRIMIEAGIFNLFNGAVITTDTFGSVPAGSISLRTSELNVKGKQALISSEARGLGGNAGNIDIGTVNFTLSDGASFSTLAETGGGGNIKFAWNGIGRINNASVTTNVQNGAGGAGTIEFGTTPVALLDFDTLFEQICGELATGFATYEGLKAYDPESAAPPVLIVSGSTIDASAASGSGGKVVIGSKVVLISDGDLPPDIDVSSQAGPDGSLLSPPAFAPPPMIIVPERNVTTRCETGRPQSALTDNLTGRTMVGADPSALLPIGRDAAEDLVTAAAARLCAV